MAPAGSGLKSQPDLAHDNEPLHRLLYGGRMIEFYERFLGGAVRHYDFTWMRAIAPGHGTHPHGDVVFMGRGTHDLYTAWTPLGDVDYELGGLMILEGSHRLRNLRDGYLTRDVDEYCENVPGEEEYRDIWEESKTVRPGFPRFHVLQLQDFLQAILEDREPAVTGEEARKALEIILAIYHSSRTGQPIRLPLSRVTSDE